MLINIYDNRKWGYYNSETKNTIPCRFDDSSDFLNGGKNEPRLFGLIDNNGYELLPCVYGIIQFRETPEEEHYYSHDYYNPYENYTREDYLMDALDGEMDAYWNID